MQLRKANVLFLSAKDAPSKGCPWTHVSYREMRQRAVMDDIDAADGVMDGRYFGTKVPGSTKCVILSDSGEREWVIPDCRFCGKVT